jgi:hypothetical protein
MAGRIRTVKPEFFEDSATATLSSDAAITFIAMWTLADDHGNLRASDEWLKAYVFHSRKPTITYEAIRAELAKKLVAFYDVEGQTYAHIRGWSKHQRIDNAGEPRVPLPPGYTVRREHLGGEGKRARYRYITERTDGPKPATVATVGRTDCHGGNSDGPSLPPLDHDHDHDHDHDQEGEAAVATPAADPRPSGWDISELGKTVGRTLVTHQDLFARLTRAEMAPFVERIDKELAKLEPRDVWTDLETEVNSWVSYARGKAEGLAMSPTQVLGKVEDLARTRCRERSGKARIERERERQGPRVAPGRGPASSVGDYDPTEDIRAMEAAPRRPSRGGDPTSTGDLFGGRK